MKVTDEQMKLFWDKKNIAIPWYMDFRKQKQTEWGAIELWIRRMTSHCMGCPRCGPELDKRLNKRPWTKETLHSRSGG